MLVRSLDAALVVDAGDAPGPDAALRDAASVWTPPSSAKWMLRHHRGASRAARLDLALTKSSDLAAWNEMKKVSTHEAKTHLSRLLSEVEAGQEILICRGATPAARLVPLTRRAARRRPPVGTVTSDPVRVSEDAFAPLTNAELETWGL